MLDDFLYIPSKAMARLARERGFEKEGEYLTKTGMQLRFFKKGSDGRPRVAYQVELGFLPDSLRLWPEGETTGRFAARGMTEIQTGDQDFDDTFWVEGYEPEVKEFLTADRRAVLTEFAHDLPIDKIEEGELRGELFCQHYGRLVKLVDRLERLRDELAHPPAQVRRRPAGFVRAAKRRFHVTWCWVAGLLLLAGSGVYADMMMPLDWKSLHVWCVLTLALTAASFLYCAVCLMSGSSKAPLGLKLARILVALATVLLLIATWSNPEGHVLGILGAGFWAQVGLYRASYAWLRLGLEGPRAA